MSIVKTSATALVLSGIATAAFAQSDSATDRRDFWDVLNTNTRTGTIAETYAYVPEARPMTRMAPVAQPSWEAAPVYESLPTQTNN